MSEAALRIVIVDDETPARNRLRDLLADCAQSVPLRVQDEASNGRMALELLSSQPADVVLLDVRMPEMDGIEVAHHLLKLERPPAVIFTTAYDAYAISAFEVHAVDYLLKPIRAERLREALLRARTARLPDAEMLRELSPDGRAFLSASERGKIHLIPVGEIVYLKAEQKYVTARTKEREYLIDESLTKLENEYAGRFVRVHRNCLVAHDAIRGFERAEGDGEGRWVVLLKFCDEKIAVSRRQQYVVRDLGRQ